MTELRIRGIISKISYEEVKLILEEYFAHSKVFGKIRVFGEEIKMESEKLDFYCYSSFNGYRDGDLEDFYVHVDCKQGCHECLTFIQEFSNHLISLNIIFEMTYVQVDGQGFELHEEVKIRHPKFEYFIKNNVTEGAVAVCPKKISR